MRLLPIHLQSAMRPRMACEIAPDGILAASSATAESPLGASAFVPLPANSLSARASAASTAPVLQNRDSILSALRSALDALDGRGRDLTLILPDAYTRVLLLDFDTLPPKAQDALALIRFRLRKLVPFDADSAAVSYQIVRAVDAAAKNGPVQAVVAATPAEIREEFESLVRGADREPGVVLPATLAALAALPDSGSHLLVHTGSDSVTTAITRNGELLLYRGSELADTEPAELAQAVLVAAAYYEDTVRKSLEEVWVAGLEAPAELRSRLEADGPWQIPLRSLTGSDAFPSGVVPSGVAAGRFASVVGALRG